MPTPSFARRQALTFALASLVLGGAGTPLLGQSLAEARVGIRYHTPLVAPEVEPRDTAARPVMVSGDRMPVGQTEQATASIWRHLGVGFLIGAGAGLVLGLHADLTCECDAYVPATVYFVPYGAALGTLVGGVVWAFRQPSSRRPRD